MVVELYTEIVKIKYTLIQIPLSTAIIFVIVISTYYNGSVMLLLIFAIICRVIYRQVSITSYSSTSQTTCCTGHMLNQQEDACLRKKLLYCFI